MKKYLTAFVFCAALFQSINSTAQQTDSTKKILIYSGSLGITTNGFSIIPTFSLNKPAVMAQLSWRRNKFSIEPDIRLVPDFKRGSLVLWFRYQLLDNKKFYVRTGMHPALNLREITVTRNGTDATITQMRRFIAFELAPAIKLTKNWRAGFYYMQSNGLQKDGPITSHFITMNSSINNVSLTHNLRFNLYGAIYYLYLDGKDGKYFTGTASIAHKNIPLSIESSINKTITSVIPGNKDFIWSLSLKYNFRKTFKKIK